MSYSLKKIGMAFILIGVVLVLIYVFFYQELLGLLLRLLSSDGAISATGEYILKSGYFFAVLVVVAVGVVCIKAEDAAWRAKLGRTFWEDPILPNTSRWNSPRWLFFVSSLIGLLLVVSIMTLDPSSDLWNVLYQEDGVFESLTAVLFLIAAFLLAKAVFLVKGRLKEPGPVRWLSLFYLFTALVFFVYAMEEISWGQRVFGWGTPSAFEGNLQNETNLHNYIGYPFPFLYIYIGLAVVPLLVVVSIIFSMYDRWPILTNLVLPAPYLLGLGIIIGFIAVAYYQEQELLEELLAFFVFFYSLRLSRVMPAYFGYSAPRLQRIGAQPRLRSN